MSGGAFVADPLGVRPCYVVVRGDSVVATNRLAGALHAAGSPAADPSACARWLCDWRFDPPPCPWSGVVRLAPGEGWERGRRVPRADAFRVPGPTDDIDAAGGLLSALRASVAEAVADGSPAVALSGGLDSCALLALAVDLGARPVAWQLDDGFADPGETALADVLVDRLGVERHVVEVDVRQLPALFADTVRAAEGLVVNGRAVAKLAFFRAVAASGAPRLLVGVGADELLVGKPSDLGPDRADEPPWAAWDRPARDLVRAALLEPPVRARTDADGHRLDPRLRQLRNKTARLVFPVELAAARACGLEVAAPFLAPAMCDAALRTPAAAFVGAGPSGSRFGKVPLRHALHGLLPTAFLWQTKTPVIQRTAADPALRAAWADVFVAHLEPDAAVRLGLDLRVLAAYIERYRHGTCAAAWAPALEAALMALASMAILTATDFPVSQP